MSAEPASPDHAPADPAALPDLATIAARITCPVVLVGLMGVGKSTVGRKLASLLHRDFVDADEAIVEAAQLSIPEIFEQFGEPYFRDGERRVIARLIEEGHGVIATGGGAFVDPSTRALILERGIAVWIDCDVDTLVERTARRNNRPLLRNGNPKEILTRLAAERAPFYAEAPIRVVSENGPHADTARAIIEAIDQWL
jgi:shikimate kinase